MSIGGRGATTGYRLGFRHGGDLVTEGTVPPGLADFLSIEMTRDPDDLDSLLEPVSALRRGWRTDLYRHYNLWRLTGTAAGIDLCGHISLAVFETALRRMRALFSDPRAWEPVPPHPVVWETDDRLRLADRDGTLPDTRFLEAPPIWAVVAGFADCVDWPRDNEWPTATRPPEVGDRYEVAVRAPFEVARSGEFWTLFEAGPEAANGWEADRPEGPSLVRLVRCRHLADDAPADGIAAEASVAVEVLETMSLADLAALPVAAEPDRAFHAWIDSGWAPPLENRGRRVAVGGYDQVAGDDGGWFFGKFAGDGVGAEVLVYGGCGRGARFVWAGRRKISAEEAALIARGSDPA